MYLWYYIQKFRVSGAVEGRIHKKLAICVTMDVSTVEGFKARQGRVLTRGLEMDECRSGDEIGCMTQRDSALRKVWNSQFSRPLYSACLRQQYLTIFHRKNVEHSQLWYYHIGCKSPIEKKWSGSMAIHRLFKNLKLPIKDSMSREQFSRNGYKLLPWHNGHRR